MSKKRVKSKQLSHDELAMAMLDPDSEYFDEEQYAMWGHLHPSYNPEDDDWEITNYGIDPELGGRHGIDFDDEVGFRD